VNIQQIPLNHLVSSKANRRKTDRMSGIEELAASIKAHGLLQNLQVRASDDGKFEVVAGMRRLAALKRLAKEKAIARTPIFPATCAMARTPPKSASPRTSSAYRCTRRPVRGVQGAGR
jgi:ParB family chromosome partitioning protein